MTSCSVKKSCQPHVRSAIVPFVSFKKILKWTICYFLFKEQMCKILVLVKWLRHRQYKIRGWSTGDCFYNKILDWVLLLRVLRIVIRKVTICSFLDYFFEIKHVLYNVTLLFYSLWPLYRKNITINNVNCTIQYVCKMINTYIN